MEKTWAFDRHFYLYAKGWYDKETKDSFGHPIKLKKDILADLRILIGKRCGMDAEYVSMGNITHILLNLALPYLVGKEEINDFILNLFPSNWWKYGVKRIEIEKTENFEREMLEILCLKCLGVLANQKVVDIPIELGEPDPDILNILTKTENKC